jgi:hypothetical protein
MRDFLTVHLSPQTLLDALEDLIREQCLSAREAHALEEAVLAKTHATGLWK